jgi:hypothetical protein
MAHDHQLHPAARVWNRFQMRYWLCRFPDESIAPNSRPGGRGFCLRSAGSQAALHASRDRKHSYDMVSPTIPHMKAPTPSSQRLTCAVSLSSLSGRIRRRRRQPWRSSHSLAASGRICSCADGSDYRRSHYESCCSGLAGPPPRWFPRQCPLRGLQDSVPRYAAIDLRRTTVVGASRDWGGERMAHARAYWWLYGEDLPVDGGSGADDAGMRGSA